MFLPKCLLLAFSFIVSFTMNSHLLHFVTKPQNPINPFSPVWVHLLFIDYCLLCPSRRIWGGFVWILPPCMNNASFLVRNSNWCWLSEWIRLSMRSFSLALFKIEQRRKCRSHGYTKLQYYGYSLLRVRAILSLSLLVAMWWKAIFRHGKFVIWRQSKSDRAPAEMLLNDGSDFAGELN